MKTRIIVSDFSVVEGGATAVAIDHAVKLAKIGYKVIYLTGDSGFNKVLSENSVQVISVYGKYNSGVINKILFPFKFFWNYSAYVKITAALKEVPKDNSVIYIHSWTKRISSSLFSAVRKSEIDVRIVAHDYFLECPNGGYFNYNKGRSCTLNPLTPACFLSQCDKRNFFEKYIRLFRSVIQKIILSKNNFKICYVSDYQRKVMRTSLIKSKDDLVLPNIVNIDQSTRVVAENNKNIVFVGRFDKEKGVCNLVKALKKADLQAVFVGSGALSSFIHDSGTASIVYNWCDRQKVFKILKSARVFVFPSLWHEADPLSVLESASMGIPRIISNKCAAKTGVIDNKTGFLVDPEDVKGLSELLTALVLDDGLIKKVSIDTYKWARDEIEIRNRVNKEFLW